MSRYSKVDRRIWADQKFRDLTPLQPSGQALWFFLLTTPKLTAIPGLFQAGEAEMAEFLHWPLEAFREAFGEAIREGMAKFDPKARLVWLPNGWKYNEPESPNVVRSWRIPWDEMPECSLKLESWQILKAFTEGKGEGFAKAFRESCPKPLAKALANQEPEPEQEQKKKESVGITAGRARKPPPEQPQQQPLPPTPTSAPGLQLLPIPSNWQPAQATLERLRMDGIPAPTAETIVAFRAHYETEGRRLEKRAWESLFVKWCARERVYEAPRVSGGNHQRTAEKRSLAEQSADEVRRAGEVFGDD